MDETRFTTLACYAMCGPFNRSAFVTDVVSWNLYLGWYVPGLFLNKLWFGFFHLVHPTRALGMSEYGCEAMPNLHSSKPRRGDHSEEYQCVYHEYMAKFFAERPWVWASHVWNMFDFAADARDQGGEPGMNHKGLVTFDRKIKKDAFCLYKCWWNPEPMVHICSKRFRNRARDQIHVKVYSNQPQVTLVVNGHEVATKACDRVFEFDVSLQQGENRIEARAGGLSDEATFIRVSAPNPAYSLQGKGGGGNWT
ncbi:MAG: glycoside hydrolase family 2 protein [Coriobacteriaceae bacterium]|nr:glycoside hydrolase family 2 protein [Coriobacteriaceae bacterium]